MNAPITHINCLGINFPIARASVTQKNCFRIICVIISGLIVIDLGIWVCGWAGGSQGMHVSFVSGCFCRSMGSGVVETLPDLSVTRVVIPATWYRPVKRGIPEKCWQRPMGKTASTYASTTLVTPAPTYKAKI